MRDVQSIIEDAKEVSRKGSSSLYGQRGVRNTLLLKSNV